MTSEQPAKYLAPFAQAWLAKSHTLALCFWDHCATEWSFALQLSHLHDCCGFVAAQMGADFAHKLVPGNKVQWPGLNAGGPADAEAEVEVQSSCKQSLPTAAIQATTSQPKRTLPEAPSPGPVSDLARQAHTSSGRTSPMTDRVTNQSHTSQQTMPCVKDLQAAKCSHAQGGPAARTRRTKPKAGMVQASASTKKQESKSSDSPPPSKESAPRIPECCSEASLPASAQASSSTSKLQVSVSTKHQGIPSSNLPPSGKENAPRIPECYSEASLPAPAPADSTSGNSKVAATLPLPTSQQPQQSAIGVDDPIAKQPCHSSLEARPGDSSKQPASALMHAWEESVSAYLEWQMAVCTEHRSATCCVSQLEKAQAFSRLILLQAMHRLSLAYRASQQIPRRNLPGRSFGIPGDRPILDYITVFRPLEALEIAHANLSESNDQSAVASQALALWRAASEAGGWSSTGQEQSLSSHSANSAMPGSSPNAVVPEELLPVSSLSWTFEMCLQSGNSWSNQSISRPQMRPEALHLAAVNRVKLEQAMANLKARSHQGDRAAGHQASLPHQAAISKAGRLSAADRALALEMSNAAAAALMAEEDINKAAARKKEDKARRRKQARKKASHAPAVAPAVPQGTSLLPASIGTRVYCASVRTLLPSTSSMSYECSCTVLGVRQQMHGAACCRVLMLSSYTTHLTLQPDIIVLDLFSCCNS